MTWFGVLTAVAAALTAVALLVRRSSTLSVWLLLVTATTVPFVTADPPRTAVPFTLFLLLTGPGPALPGIPAVLVGYAWPLTPPDRAERLVVGSVLGSTVLLGAGAAILFDPVSAGCNACSRNLVEILDAQNASVAVQRLSLFLTVGWCALLAVLTALRWRSATRLARRHSGLILCGATAMALITATAAARGLALPAPGELDDVQRRLWLGQCVAIALLVTGIVVQLILARATSARMARRVIAAIPDPQAVQSWLRDGVGDAHLSVTYVREDGARVDADGVVVADDDPRSGVRLARDGVVFADVRSACRSIQELDLLRACARSAGLALEYVAARARLRAELRRSAAVRTRIVEAGDRERRRLERNLHDGAQQHLVALGVMLASVARSQAGSTTAAYHQEIDAALAELRTVARGLFPASLAEAGVAAALRELGDHTPVPLVVRGDVARDLPLPVGMAVYQLVLDASGLVPTASVVRVVLDEPDGMSVRVVVTVEEPDPTAVGTVAPVAPDQRRLLHAEDRFVALGGRLDPVVGSGDLGWEGVVPCG